MSYLQQRNLKDRPGAVAAVIAIHAMIGYALVTGLSFEKIVETVKNPEGIFVPEVKLPPPPPKPPEQKVEPDTQLVQPPVHAPKPPIDVSPVRPPIDTTPIIIPSIPDPIPYVVPKPTPQPGPAAKPAFDPVGAKPKNNPGGWVTTNDYRSSWIRSEWTGTARFRVEVGANGRVESCTITGSSGHDELDKATCALVTSRARFDPAKDGTGAKVSGSYSSSVRWELPE